MPRFWPFKSKPPVDPKIKASRLNKKALHFNYDFDMWYEKLKAYTFKSDIVAIEPDTAQAIVNYYSARYYKRDVLTKKNVELLDKLQKDIQARFKVLPSGHQFFVRMSNRSPKDGTPLNKGKSMLDVYQEINSSTSDDANAKMVKICDAQMKMLACTNADEVMNLLLSSERVYGDLMEALDCHSYDKKDKWKTSVILREWIPNLKQDFEFRIFVANNQVTGISQYNHYCAFDSLIELNQKSNLATLNQRLIAYATKLNPVIQEANYVLDVALVDDQLYVVELNPLDKSTGPCLFSWERDNDLLMGKTSQQAPELRINLAPHQNIDVTIKHIIESEVELSGDAAAPYYEFSGYKKFSKHTIGKEEAQIKNEKFF